MDTWNESHLAVVLCLFYVDVRLQFAIAWAVFDTVSPRDSHYLRKQGIRHNPFRQTDSPEKPQLPQEMETVE